MTNHSYSVNGNLKDLNPIGYGYEQCTPGYTAAPRSKGLTLVHYVEKGCGTLEKNGKLYEIHPGDAFIILADELATYRADENDPWFYRYIGFDGALAADFEKLPTVFRSDGKIFYDLAEVEGFNGNKASYIASVLFKWHSEICGEKNAPPNKHAELIKDYINQNYMHDLKVESIAEMMDLSRSYIVRCFKSATGQTIQQYIISVRLRAARHCIENGMSIKETTFACGFNDCSNFSKLYKRSYGKSAMVYKKEIQQAKSLKNKN